MLTDMSQSTLAISAPIITAFSHGQRYSRLPDYPINSDSFISIETG